MKRVALRIAAIAAALLVATAGAASAGEWQRSGGLWYGSGGRDGTCIWYPIQSSCAGWNYWTWTNGTVDSGAYVKYLAGYEDAQRIRGIWLYAGQNGGVWVSGVGMSGYLKAVATWWEGQGKFYWAYACTC